MKPFQEYLAWKFNPKRKREDSWHRVNIGRGVPPATGKNFQKRIKREAHKIDRLAQIRAAGQVSLRHVRKLKHIPVDVFA